MVKMEEVLTCEFTFMLGVYGIIFITRVLPDDVTYIGLINYLYSKAMLGGSPVLSGL